MNFPHEVKVPIRGARKEKSTPHRGLRRSHRAYEALILSIFLLCLFLTGCSGSMVASSGSTGAPESVIRLSGEANLPPARAAEPIAPVKPEPSALDRSDMDGALKAFIQQEAVIERVRVVVGWLKFVGQNRSAELVEKGWMRLNSGQQLGALKTDAVAQRPDISMRELILWRQILAAPTPQSEDEAQRIEALAISLTSAMTPEDVAKIDNLLVVPERYAEY